MLTHSNWKDMTSYYKHSLLPLRAGSYGTLFKHRNDYYIGQQGQTVFGSDVITKIYPGVAASLEGKNTVTDVYGPYVFINGFENTAEAKYLIKMLPYYFNMKPRAQEKVNNILDMYGYWIRIDTRILEVMEVWHGRKCNSRS